MYTVLCKNALCAFLHKTLYMTCLWLCESSLSQCLFKQIVNIKYLCPSIQVGQVKSRCLFRGPNISETDIKCCWQQFLKNHRINLLEISQYLYLHKCALQTIYRARKGASQRAGNAHLLQCLYDRDKGSFQFNRGKGRHNLPLLNYLTQFCGERRPPRTLEGSKHGILLSQSRLLLLPGE